MSRFLGNARLFRSPLVAIALFVLAAASIAVVAFDFVGLRTLAIVVTTITVLAVADSRVSRSSRS